MKTMTFVFTFISFIIIHSPLTCADVNLRVDPLQLFYNNLNLDLDLPINDKWTLGPTLDYQNRSEDDWDINEYHIGMRGNYWFNKNIFSQGWYLGPSISYINIEAENDNDGFDSSGKSSGLEITVMSGYQGMWESFNINLGLGPFFHAVKEIEVKNDQGEKHEYGGHSIGLVAELTLGWKF